MVQDLLVHMRVKKLQIKVLSANANDLAIKAHLGKKNDTDLR